MITVLLTCIQSICHPEKTVYQLLQFTSECSREKLLKSSIFAKIKVALYFMSHHVVKHNLLFITDVKEIQYSRHQGTAC